MSALYKPSKIYTRPKVPFCSMVALETGLELFLSSTRIPNLSSPLQYFPRENHQRCTGDHKGSIGGRVYINSRFADKFFVNAEDGEETDDIDTIIITPYIP